VLAFGDLEYCQLVTQVEKKMLSQILWLSSTLLEVLLLSRGIANGLYRRFPVFYAYLFFVLVQDLLRFLSIRIYGDGLVYGYVYWTTEFLAVAFGCAVVLEIYRNALASFPGTARMARALLAGVFLLAVLKGVITAAGNSDWWLKANTLGIEEAVRTVQAVGILALIAVFLFYSIPFGMNLRGLLLGYGLFVSLRVISLMFVPAVGHGFWFYAYSASYPVVLGLWIVCLWSLSEVPERGGMNLRLENDYQRVAAATQRRLAGARRYLHRAAQP
jgi:hypothetical protein